jgi:hypothetical protein
MATIVSSSRGEARAAQKIAMIKLMTLLASSILLHVTSAQMCGSQAGGAKCYNNLCCSRYGYCGQTSAYCSLPGCQSQCSYAAPKGLIPGRMLFDYLGSNGVPITFNDIPITQSDVMWVLGLSFAIDMSPTGVTQNGVHSVYWNPTLTKAAAKTWRQAHSNGRIVIAIGGSVLYSDDSIYDVNWYDPPNPTLWLANAVSSLTEIVQDYGADGIDIDIERFPNGVGSTFQSLMGQLITSLKSNGVISFVSMAPGYDQLARYTDLYSSYGSYIDAANYQFYGDKGLNTCAKYTARFNQVIQLLPVNVVGLSTELNGTDCITGATFYNCVTDIKNAGNNIAGVYLWNADISKLLNNGFAAETAVAGIL